MDIHSRVPLKNGSEGRSIPMIGLGTYLCSDETAKESVACALSNGYRHIDTAEFYNNHEGIAEAIADSGVNRSDIYITDKLSPGGVFGAPSKTYDDTITALKLHLNRLKTTYVDLYLVHHAFARDERINQYRAIVDMQKDGLVKDVGVSNWNISHVEEIKAAGLPLPAVNQIELHPLCTQTKLVAYLHDNGIVPVAYSSLAPAPTWRVEPGQLSSKEVDTIQPYEQLLLDMSSKYSVSIPQLLLRWAVDKGYPIIPKSSKSERIVSNTQLYHFSLAVDDIATLDGLDQDKCYAWPNANPLHAE